MTLTSIFNKNFAKENIKKSKPILLLVGILFPILFATVVVNLVDSNNIIDLPRMNILMWIFLFLPILISYVMFGFLNKRKSVDFVNSLPITRKQVFFTNTIMGIVLIEILLALNMLFLFVTTLFLKDIILPGGVLLDYFILWSVCYTFIFIVTNLSISLSGNMITTIMMTLLFVFILPFTYQYMSFHNYSKYLIKGNDTIEKLAEKNNMRQDVDNKGYYYTDIYVRDNIITNIVYDNSVNNIFMGFRDYKVFNINSIIMTFILSIIYLIIGYYVYLHKKMEVVEVSFKSYKIHTLFKSLMLLPLVVLLYNVLDEGFLVILLLLVIIGLYYVIDLVTRIGIRDFKKSIIYFIIFIIAGFGYTFISDIDKEKEFKFKLHELENVSIESNNFNFNNIEDGELINKIYLDSFKLSPDYTGDYKITYKFGNKTIVQNQTFNKEFINEIKKYIKDNKLEKHLVNLNYDDIETVRIYDRAFKKEELSDLKKYINKINKEDLVLENDNIFDIGIYKYDKSRHEILELNINNVEFYNYLLGIYNKDSMKDIKNIKSKDISFINIEKYDNGSNDFYEINSNLHDLILKEILKNKDDNFDINSSYLEINIHYYKDGIYNSSRVFINDYDKILEILNKNKEIKNEY